MAFMISAPVGPWDDKLVTNKGGNKMNDIRTVQKMLTNASTRLKDSKLDPGKPDGKIGRVSSRSSTLKAIAAYEKKKRSSEDMRLDPGDIDFKALQLDGAKLPSKRISISNLALTEFMNATLGGRIKYGLGAKASPLTINPSKIKKIDCSGYVQYLLYKVSSGSIRIKAGSWHQNEYFKTQRFEKIDYETEAARSDGILRLGYFYGGGGGGIGHIWFVLNGQTIESSGGKGPNRRAWNTAVLKRKVEQCYVIGSVVGPSMSIARPADNACTIR